MALIFMSSFFVLFGKKLKVQLSLRKVQFEMDKAAPKSFNILDNFSLDLLLQEQKKLLVDDDP